MSDATEHRKLAAIMFTDMVGYSALAQRDEKLALQLLAECQRLLRMQFTAFNGREVKNTGDGFLVEFPSALAAAECAVEIQRALAARNGTQPLETQFQVRIGLHVGDVVHREADMYGDGVNIAARIEPLAVGGGICLSDAVYAQVRNKLGAGMSKLDSPQLKHIELPLEVYRVMLPWEPSGGKIAAPTPNRPSGGGLKDFIEQRRIKDPRLRTVIIIAVLIFAGWVMWLDKQSEKKAEKNPSEPTRTDSNTATNLPPQANQSTNQPSKNN